MAFGDQIQAGLMRPDYSGIIQAGQATGMGYAALGQGIGNALESIGKMKEQQKQEESQISVAENIAKLLESKAPGLVPGAGDLAMQMANTELPRSQRLGTAQYILNALSLGTKIQEERRQQEELGLMRQRVGIDAYNAQTSRINSMTGGETDPYSGAFDFGDLPSGGGGMPSSGVLPNIPTNSYVEGLNPNMIR